MNARKYAGGAMVAGACFVWVLTLGAQTLPKLPKPVAIEKTTDSPGQVVFDHAMHVDESRPDCTVCHPRPYRILRAGSPARPQRITHDRMQKGEQCGSCHDGRKAFALDQDCSFCHKLE